MPSQPGSSIPPASSVSSQQERVTWVRHPADVARMLLAASAWLLIGGLAIAYPEDARSLSLRLVGLVDGLPDTVAAAIVGLVQVAALLAPLVAVALVRRGRWRELVLASGAAAVTALLGALLSGRLARGVPVEVLAEAERPSWVTGSAFPSGTYLAAMAAAATVLAPTVPRSWRRVVWSVVAVVALARVVTAVETPIGIGSSLAAGVFVGALVMVAFRAPLRWPPAAAVERALVDAGVAVGEVAPTGERHRHGPTYLAGSAGDATHFVKLVGRDERDAELLSRVVRALRVADPGDRRAVGATETVTHEALSLVLAARAGVAVPGVVTVTQAEDRSAVLVMEHVAGRRLDTVDEVDDGVLGATFDLLATLHAARIAHGWASLHHVLLADDGSVVLLDLRWASLSASDDQLARDLAELLVAAAAVAGPERAVAAARAAFPAEALARALPLIQPLAVSPETRAAVRRDKELLPDLRDAVQQAAGVEAYEMAKLERLTVRKVVMFAGTLLMAGVLLSILGNAGEIWEAVQGVDRAYLPVLVLLPLLGFPAGALCLMGAVTVRLAFLRTVELMFAQAFLNRFTPANAGGMALKTRYLQRNGVPLLNAASSVAITSAANGAMQVVMAVMFFTWAGRSGDSPGFSLPSSQVIGVVALVVLVVVGVACATAFGRKLLRELRVNLVSILADLRQLGRQPTKLLMLFGGAFGGKLLTIIVLAQTMRAFGSPVDFAVLGAMYIAANTVASMAPTPGGVGAIEAALTAGLTGLGEDPGQAAAIVLVFRTVTYWLPILPCWLMLVRIQRTGDA